MRIAQRPLDIYNEALDELDKARSKFPKQNIWVTLAALTEEIGELNQSILQYHERPDDVQLEDIRKQLVQSITMLLRVALDCELEY